MNNLTSLFLSQSYQDTWEDYNRSLSSENFPKWDYIILTASNENQAVGYRSQIESRRDVLPPETHFAVIPDEGNVRVGSGGATLSVLRYIYKREEEILLVITVFCPKELRSGMIVIWRFLLYIVKHL